MTRPDDRVLRVENAHLRYGVGEAGTYAVRGISLVARPGEVLMIKGPSGSGKTTLLQLMGALKTPDKGFVSLCGERTDMGGAAQLRQLRLRRVGFVFQFFNLFPNLLAWENVAVPLDLLGSSREAGEERARALLDEMGLGDKADMMPGTMSGGQRQRVAVARALAHEPDIILADEPTAALDSASGASVIGALRKLAHERDRIVVVVSHDPRLEDKVDRLVTIEDGLLVADSTLGIEA